MSPGQTLCPCHQLEFVLPWAEPPAVSGQNSKVKWVLPATQPDHSCPREMDQPETTGIVLGEMDLAFVTSKTWSLLT